VEGVRERGVEGGVKVRVGEGAAGWGEAGGRGERAWVGGEVGVACRHKPIVSARGWWGCAGQLCRGLSSSIHVAKKCWYSEMRPKVVPIWQVRGR
jgi:hypothetical protein